MSTFSALPDWQPVAVKCLHCGHPRCKQSPGDSVHECCLCGKRFTEAERGGVTPTMGNTTYSFGGTTYTLKVLCLPAKEAP